MAQHHILPRKPGEKDRQVVTTSNSGRLTRWPLSTAQRHIEQGDIVIEGGRLSQIDNGREHNLSQTPNGERFRNEHTPEGGKSKAFNPYA